MRSKLAATMLALVVAAGATVVTADQAQPAQGAKPAQDAKPAPKPHDMTGCLAKGDTAMTYRLTNVENSKFKTVDITEAAASLKLDAHVGHKVTITGTATTPPKGDASKKPAGEHYMRVEGVKHVSPTCP